MATVGNHQVAEIEAFEADDSLHDFGGPHSGKGSDFASYWVIARVIELEKAGKGDYLFVCEYMQDVAEFNARSAPSNVKLFQLKKKEGGYWKASDLTGQTDKSKAPKFDKPVLKLLGHVRAFKSMSATGAFVSNRKFDVSLATGKSSVNDEVIGLHLLDAAHVDGIRNAVAAKHGVPPADVGLEVIELHYTNLAIDDMSRHMNGVMLEYLKKLSPEHASQADSLVDTLFSRIRARARRTGKCASWPELVSKRGFGRDEFADALQSLEAIPDKAGHRKMLLAKLADEGKWSFFQRTQVEVALNRCALEKVVVGEACRWQFDRAGLAAILQTEAEAGSPDLETFERARDYLGQVLAELLAPEIRALAIYEMTEWTLSQTLA